MNEVGYGVAVPGNHEFDYGMAQFFDAAREGELPVRQLQLRATGRTG